MEYRFSPWRYAYIENAGKNPDCVFCQALASADDRAPLIIHRGEHCFILLNAYPYNSGHVMIVPFAHVDELRKLSGAQAGELMTLAQRMEDALRREYRALGINLGMNIGECAGAGVAGHIHMHALPRWTADSNFMTTVGETRVLPESLERTYERL